MSTYRFIDNRIKDSKELWQIFDNAVRELKATGGKIKNIFRDDDDAFLARSTQHDDDLVDEGTRTRLTIDVFFPSKKRSKKDV